MATNDNNNDISIVEQLRGINFPIRIGQDIFVEKSGPNLRDDLFEELRRLTGQNTFR